MASPLAHRTTRVTISGTFGGGVEEWSTGFYFGNAGADADLPTQQLADDIRTAWAAAVPNLSQSTLYESLLVKCSSIGTDGKSDANDTVYSQMPANTKGTSATWYPPQLSVVATLYGPQARGLASKGRMYLPGVSFPIDGTGHFTTGNAQALANTVKNFIIAVNASTASPNVVLLASHGQLNKDGTPKLGGRGPVSHEVIGVKVGNVYDTQRRRRNGLVEAYSTASLL